MKRTRREYERVLAAVFGLLIQCGFRERAVSAIATRALRSAVRKATSLGQSGGGELATFSLVLDMWHRNRRYLTSKGKPKAIPLFGRAPSVEALIKSEAQTFDTVELVYRMKSLRLIKSSSRDRYRPISDIALVSIFGPIVLQHVAQCLMSLLETVEDNLKDESATAPLLERSAEVPDLPADCVQSFQQFSRIQGGIFARTINDWLETRRARGGVAEKRKSVRAGVHVHAFVAPLRTRARGLASVKRSPV